MTEENNTLDIDVERYSPANAKARYEAAGYSGPHLQLMLSIAAGIYARPHEEVRETVAKRRAEGREIF